MITNKMISFKRMSKRLPIALSFIICHSSFSPAWAQTELNMDNGVIPIADDRGFTLQSNDGSFVFKPYLYLQSTLNFKYYDDEGLDKAYNQDNARRTFAFRRSRPRRTRRGGKSTARCG